MLINERRTNHPETGNRYSIYSGTIYSGTTIQIDRICMTTFQIDLAGIQGIKKELSLFIRIK